jgi:hypothetical protein
MSGFDRFGTAMMLPSRHYVSEHTRFMRELLDRKPDVELDQKKARAMWWDKRPRDLAHRREMDQARVPQSAYVYYQYDNEP